MLEVFQGLLRGEPVEEQLDVAFPFYPLTSLGMPLPGENFIANAQALGDPEPTFDGVGRMRRLTGHGPALHYLYRRALYDESFQLNVGVRGAWKLTQLVPGHLIGHETGGMSGGPRRATVMIIGKNPGNDELLHRRNLVGPTSAILFDALGELGVPSLEYGNWYCTNLVKWPQLDMQSDSLPIAHKKDCHILLEQELRLVRPEYILCLGSDAVKWLLGTNAGVNSMVGRVADYTIPVNSPGEAPELHRAKVMAVVHPAQVYRRPEMFEEFKNQVGLFLSLCNGAEVGGTEPWIQHREVYTHRALSTIVDQIRADPDPWRRVIAVDAEWHGVHPGEPGAYLRTIQFSTKHGEAYTVVLRHQGGEPAFKPSIAHAVHELNRLLKYDIDAKWFPRLGGHFFRADLPWLIHAGIDVRDEYAPAPTHAQCKFFGGWDTGLMYHAYNEATSYRLTDMQVRLTTAPVYDVIVKDSVTDFCKAQGIKKDDLEGYGFIPSWKLHPYAGFDADITRRIAIRHLEPDGLLDKDWFGNACWEPFWVAHRASLGFLEMEMRGLMLDKDRVDKLTTLYEFAYETLLADFRKKINWDVRLDERGKIIQSAFNPDSSQQAVAFLFGDAYARKVDRETGGYISPRPADALTLNLTPVKSTGKRPRLWADLVRRGEERHATPSTDKETLGILGHAHPLAMQLRDLKFISQILKGPLRRPRRDDDGTPELDDDGNQVYDSGLASYVLSDGRLHTHLSQNKETGRASSSRPALQNLSSRREGDYARILGTTNDQGVHIGAYKELFPSPLYVHPIRSIFRAAPGHVLIGADYTGAELAMLAWLSGDPLMIEHVRRNSLPESHPDFFDIHSNMAVRCFHLDCEPTKKGLKKIGRTPLRVAAKCVVAGTRLHTTAGLIKVEEIVGEHLPPDSGERYRGALQVVNHQSATDLVGIYNGGVKPCMEVVTERGYRLESTYEHPYWVMGEDGNMTFRRGGELCLGDWVAVRVGYGPFGNDVSFPRLTVSFPGQRHSRYKPLEFPAEFTEAWAALCGIYVAEGSLDIASHALQLALAAENDPDFAAATESLLRELFGDRAKVSDIAYVEHQDQKRFVVSSLDLAQWLSFFFPGLAAAKTLPDFVFSWPERLLSVFLRWLFEGDGGPKANKRGFTIAYSTSSAVLAEQVKQLLLLFGVSVTHTTETRSGYSGLYHTLTVFGNESRANFLSRIGFVTAGKTARCRSDVGYTLDCRDIPGQVERLRALLPVVKGAAKEKCRECVRSRSRVSLNPTRLAIILAAVDQVDMSPTQAVAFSELSQIPAGVEFQRVTRLQDAGLQQVYDVQTTDEAQHLLCYNGLLTHNTVVFGIPYGRSADAIARACREEGVDVSVDECQQIMNSYFEMYPMTIAYLRACGDRAEHDHWMAGTCGRFRRFVPSRERSVLAEQRRQAQNFPEQNGVADHVSTAVFNFCRIRHEIQGLQFWMVLQMHDALLFEVPITDVPRFYVDERDAADTITRPSILRMCMVDRVPVWPRTLDNQPIPIERPYHFGIDSDIYENWGEPLTKARAVELGLDPSIV